LPEAWLFVLGGLFVVVTLFLPRGIVGTLSQGWTALADRRRAILAEKGVVASRRSASDQDLGSATPQPMPAE